MSNFNKLLASRSARQLVIDAEPEKAVLRPDILFFR